MTDNLIVENLMHSYLKVFSFKMKYILKKVKDSMSRAQINNHIARNFKVLRAKVKFVLF